MKTSGQTQVQAFSAIGTYSQTKDEFIVNTEIPDVVLNDLQGKEYRLNHFGFYDISVGSIPCLLSVFKHGHPTNRETLGQEQLRWDKQTDSLMKVFGTTNFPIPIILVISMHDEDFNEDEIPSYKEYVANEVSYDESDNSFEMNINEINTYLDKDLLQSFDEEPRTVGGGVLDQT